MVLPDLLPPTYTQMLGALSVWLAKAESQRSAGRADALLGALLPPDMFPFLRQPSKD